jgi:beta-1,4-N-acetylglucosaminyltransferase
MSSLRVGLVCSGGGHLAHMMWLRSWWEQHDRFFVTFDGVAGRVQVAEERVYWAYQPTNRNPSNLLRNLGLAWRVLRKERPDVLVSTGAGVMVPFFWVAHLLNIPTVFLEVYDRVDKPALSGRLVAPWVDQVVVQWPEMVGQYPNCVNLGTIR